MVTPVTHNKSVTVTPKKSVTITPKKSVTVTPKKMLKIVPKKPEKTPRKQPMNFNKKCEICYKTFSKSSFKMQHMKDKHTPRTPKKRKSETESELSSKNTKL